MLDDLDRFTRPFVPASRLECAGCGQHVSTSDLTPFRCPNAGRDDTDHVLVRRLDPSSVRFVAGAHPNPFVRYRELLHGWHVGRSHGASDAACVDTVERLDRAVAALDGRGFVVTPFGRAQALSEALGLAGGGVWVKDETRNVAG